MKRLILEGALGIAVTIEGIFAGFFYVEHSLNGTPLLIVISVLSIIIGLFLVYHAEQKNVAQQMIPPPTLSAEQTQPTEITQKKESLFERNSRLVSLWHKTSETRDRLKLLEIASNNKK